MKNEFEMAFESNCNYDEAIEFFEKRISLLPQVAEVKGDPRVFKDGEFWIVKQEVKFTPKAKLKFLWLRILNSLKK